MTMKLFDFKCLNGHIEEHLVDAETRQVICDCGETARRVISPVTVKLEAISGDFPSATGKWAKQHERAAKTKSG
jgi:hypothetical protein